MPVRIKPVHDFGPCTLDLDSIKGICSLVEANFPSAQYSAEDGIWEVYNEESAGFLSSIEQRNQLDSFVASATNSVGGLTAAEVGQAEVQLTFNQYQASLKFSGPPTDENKMEHFFYDLKKIIKPPTIRQRILVRKAEGNYEPLPLAQVVVTSASSILASLIDTSLDLALTKTASPYCLITLKQNPPSQFIENVKANLFSNLIWIVIGFVASCLFTFLVYWIYTTFGVNINEIIRIPTIPSPTP